MMNVPNNGKSWRYFLHHILDQAFRTVPYKQCESMLFISNNHRQQQGSVLYPIAFQMTLNDSKYGHVVPLGWALKKNRTRIEKLGKKKQKRPNVYDCSQWLNWIETLENDSRQCPTKGITTYNVID